MKRMLSAILVAAGGLAGVATAQTTPTTQPITPVPRVLTSPPGRPNIINPRPFTLSPARMFASSRYYSAMYQQVLQYGRCAANVSPTRSIRFLDALPNTPTERVEGAQLRGISRGCLPYGYAAPTIFLRAAVAEALYKSHAGDAPPRAIADSAISQFVADERTRDRTRFVDDRLFTRIAACMTSTAPDAVHKMLYTRPGTPEERQALSAVGARAPGCVGQGRKLDDTGGTPFIRAYLAESAYRLTSGHNAS